MGNWTIHRIDPTVQDDREGIEALIDAKLTALGDEFGALYGLFEDDSMVGIFGGGIEPLDLPKYVNIATIDGMEDDEYPTPQRVAPVDTWFIRQAEGIAYGVDYTQFLHRSLAFWRSCHVLHEGQFSDLIFAFEYEGLRVWLSRMNAEDGVVPNWVSIEVRNPDGLWSEIDGYQAT